MNTRKNPMFSKIFDEETLVQIDAIKREKKADDVIEETQVQNM